MPRRQSKFLFACARLTRETTNRNPKTDSTLRFRPLGAEHEIWLNLLLRTTYENDIGQGITFDNRPYYICLESILGW